MATVGLRELRQDASDLVRRVENGEDVDITVAGRLAARLTAARPRQWRSWDDISSIFAGPHDPDWARDAELVDHSLVDPWERNE